MENSLCDRGKLGPKTSHEFELSSETPVCEHEDCLSKPAVDGGSLIHRCETSQEESKQDSRQSRVRPAAREGGQESASAFKRGTVPGYPLNVGSRRCSGSSVPSHAKDRGGAEHNTRRGPHRRARRDTETQKRKKCALPRRIQPGRKPKRLRREKVASNTPDSSDGADKQDRQMRSRQGRHKTRARRLQSAQTQGTVSRPRRASRKKRNAKIRKQQGPKCSKRDPRKPLTLEAIRLRRSEAAHKAFLLRGNHGPLQNPKHSKRAKFSHHQTALAKRIHEDLVCSSDSECENTKRRRKVQALMANNASSESESSDMEEKQPPKQRQGQNFNAIKVFGAHRFSTMTTFLRKCRSTGIPITQDQILYFAVKGYRGKFDSRHVLIVFTSKMLAVSAHRALMYATRHKLSVRKWGVEPTTVKRYKVREIGTKC